MIARQANANGHDVLIRRGADRRRRVPQRNQFRPQRLKFALRQMRGVAVRRPQRSNIAQSCAGRHLPLRLAVIEQSGDLIGVELRLGARLPRVVFSQLFSDLIRLEFRRLLRRLLGLVLFQLVGDLIGFWFRIFRLLRLLGGLGLGLLRLFNLLRGLGLGFDLGLWLGFGLCFGGAAAAAESVLISGLSATFGASSFTGFGSPILSTSGFGFSSAFGAFFTPWVSCESWFADMNSTGSASTGGASLGLAAKATSPQPSTMTCAMLDMMTLRFISRPARPQSPARRGESRPPRAVPSPASSYRNPLSCRRAHRCAPRRRRAHPSPLSAWRPVRRS